MCVCVCVCVCVCEQTVVCASVRRVKKKGGVKQWERRCFLPFPFQARFLFRLYYVHFLFCLNLSACQLHTSGVLFYTDSNGEKGSLGISGDKVFRILFIFIHLFHIMFLCCFALIIAWWFTHSLLCFRCSPLSLHHCHNVLNTRSTTCISLFDWSLIQYPSHCIFLTVTSLRPSSVDTSSQCAQRQVHYVLRMPDDVASGNGWRTNRNYPEFAGIVSLANNFCKMFFR